MPPLQKRDRLYPPKKSAAGSRVSPAESFYHDMARARALGRSHAIDPRLGRGGKMRGVDSTSVWDLEGLSRNCDAARNVARAAFYAGVIQQGAPDTGRWHCIIQQQLTKALTRLPKTDVHQLVELHEPFGLSRAEWTMWLSGAFAVARAAAAFGAIGGRVYLPWTDEDVHGKIDLIYQYPSLDRGICLQVKSDAYAEETTHRVIDDAAAAADPQGYLHRFMIGVRIFGHRNPGVWTPVFLTVGQRPYLDLPDIRDCLHVFRGIHALHAACSETQGPTP